MKTITPSDSLWDETFPVLVAPKPDEALVGFLLRCDLDNGWDAGFTLRIARRNNAGPLAIAGPGDLASGYSIDLVSLARLAGGLSVDEIEGLTMRALLRWMPDRVSRRVNSVGQVRHYKICPSCVSEHFISLFFQFKDITGCAEHRVRLVERCACGAGIRPFSGQAPFTCHQLECRLPYSRFIADRLAPSEVREVSDRSAIYRDLSRFADCSGLRISGNEIRGAYRLLLARVDLPERQRRLLSDCVKRRNGPSIRNIARLLYETNEAVATLLAATALSSVSHPSAVTFAGANCPNSRCHGERALKNGHGPDGQAYSCSDCGTCFAKGRVSFSFDPIDGYPNWRAARNSLRLIALRKQVRLVVSSSRRARDRIPRDQVFRIAGVPSSAPYLSKRAGLITAFQEALASM